MPLRVLAISLDLEQDFFTKLYSKPSILSRVIHYPKPEEADSEEFGIGALAHTDYGHITILAQDPAGGLEVQLPSGGGPGEPAGEEFLHFGVPRAGALGQPAGALGRGGGHGRILLGVTLLYKRGRLKCDILRA